MFAGWLLLSYYSLAHVRKKCCLFRGEIEKVSLKNNFRSLHEKLNVTDSKIV